LLLLASLISWKNEFVLFFQRMKNTPWIGMETTKIPTFNNLKTLKVGERCMTDGFNFVAHFLLHAPSVEKLLLLYKQVCDTKRLWFLYLIVAGLQNIMGMSWFLTTTKLSLFWHVQFDDITGIKQMFNYIIYFFKDPWYGPNHPNEYHYIFQ
jgi:hypothetical protein